MESFGARLKQERERRGVTLDDIALSTKIGTRFLRALEEERFEQLPGGIFNKGFVRAYARHLGIDENQAVADYLAATGENQPPQKVDTAEPVEAQEIAPEQKEGTATVPWGIMAMALLILAFGLAIWGFHSREKASNSASQNSASPRLASSAPASTSASLPAARQSPPPSSTPVPQEISSSANSSTEAPISSPAPGSFVVLVRAREDSWVLITADGQRVMMDTLAAPAEKSIAARNNVVVRAGNVGALDFWFNGAKLPPQGDYDEVRTLNFDGKGLQPIIKAEPPASPPTPQP